MRVLQCVVLAMAATAVLAASALARGGIGFSPTSLTATAVDAEIDVTYINEAFHSDIRCDVIVDLTLSSSVPKVVGTPLGSADVEVDTEGCESGGRVGLLVGRRVTGSQGPYDVYWRAFAGTLPNVTGISFTIEDVALWVEFPPAVCLTNGGINLDFAAGGGNPAPEGQIVRSRVPMVASPEAPLACFFTYMAIGSSFELSPNLRMTLLR